MQNPLQPPLPQPPTTPREQNKLTLSVIIAASIFCLLFILSLSLSTSSSTSAIPTQTQPDPFLFPNRPSFHTSISSDPSPASVAYLISGSAGDSARILRLLFATYHPKNHYLLHLDRAAPQTDRDRLAVTVQSVPVFRAARNVDVIGNADFSYQKGSSTISATLHGASILLKLSKNWDWFINLSASDYPLVTQDDLLHILSYLPKDLNFVNHTSYIGWKEAKRLKQIIVDPGLYLVQKTSMFYASEKRELPKAFRLFSGSSFSILSRDFIEFCILGTDNFPRTLLMYLSNTPSSFSNYFPTILCNSNQYSKTIINHNFLYNQSSSKDKNAVNSTEFNAMIRSGAAFATQFPFDDPMLDRIDKEILDRQPGKVVPGGWCLGDPGNETCSVWGDADILRPGKGARRLEKQLVELLFNGKFRVRQCMIE